MEWADSPRMQEYRSEARENLAKVVAGTVVAVGSSAVAATAAPAIVAKTAVYAAHNEAAVSITKGIVTAVASYYGASDQAKQTPADLVGAVVNKITRDISHQEFQNQQLVDKVMSSQSTLPVKINLVPNIDTSTGPQLKQRLTY